MALNEYHRKRKFDSTPEPRGSIGSGSRKLRFVVQKHDATRLHYDFRLELDGVLKSWAVPKGPSMDPAQKRLAMMVEDHPLDYGDFEGTIPKGNYGAGTVMVWDSGFYEPVGLPEGVPPRTFLEAGLHKGHLGIMLAGEKLRGTFDLVRIKQPEEKTWLLNKRNDVFADPAATLGDLSVSSGRTLEEISHPAPGETEVWVSSSRNDDLDFAGAPEAEMPTEAQPMLADTAKAPFDRKGWLFEVKWDGFRILAYVRQGRLATLRSRNGHDLSERFRPIADGLASVGHDAVLDGEIVVLDDEGKPRFGALRHFEANSTASLFYYVFDCLYLDGHDLQHLPLTDRKRLARAILPKGGRILYSDEVQDQGKAFFEAIEAQNLEGMIGKKADSRYQQGKRSKSWLKVKNRRRLTAFIGGFTEPRSGVKGIGALLLGQMIDGQLDYIGHTGSGLNRSNEAELTSRLAPLKVSGSPFAKEPKANADVTWVRPEVVCEVEFTEVTEDGMLRMPVFISLVEPAASQPAGPPAKPEAAEPAETQSSQTEPEPPRRRFTKQGKKDTVLDIDGQRVAVSNPTKIYFPAERITKLALVEYYRSVAGAILPHLLGRPESLHRFPDGITGESFFHKDIGEKLPEWIETATVESSSGATEYLICSNEATLAYMANLGCIEINPWLSRTGTLEKPDFAVIDLDPEAIGFGTVVETARVLQNILKRIKVAGFCKTSGATGLHIFMPLGARYSYEQSRQFCELLATLVHSQLPDTTSLVRSPAKRQKKVYVDFLQNRRGQTLASAYSVRPHPGAPVSAPLAWDEVNEDLDPAQYTLKTMPGRIEKLGDIWIQTDTAPLDMNAALEALASAAG